MTCGRVSSWKDRPTFEELAVMFEAVSYTHLGADQFRDRLNGIPFVPQKLRNFPAILEHRKIQTNPL